MATTRKKEKAFQPAGDATQGLKVLARRTEGFYRLGRYFSATEPTTLPLSELSEGDVQTLRDEPQLFVADVTIEAEAAKE